VRGLERGVVWIGLLSVYGADAVELVACVMVDMVLRRVVAL